MEKKGIMEKAVIKGMVKAGAECILRKIPVAQKCRPVFNRILGEEKVEAILLREFANKLVDSFDTVVAETAKNRCVMNISEGLWGGTYFNVTVLSNMISLMVYALYKGCIPSIELNRDNEEKFSWDWYFEQPYKIIGLDNLDDFKRIKCNKKSVMYCPAMDLAYQTDSKDFQTWSFLFRKFVKLNSETARYVEEEQTKLQIGSDTLGILMRGTDYLTLKPKGHPIQPDPQTLLDDAKEMFLANGYEKVYVATDERKMFNLACESFGINRVLENKRTYYDEIFYRNETVTEIGQVHFERENDNYWKGIEYLSSLILLSRCNGIVAGNCGGTLFAVLFSGEYKVKKIFMLGYY